MGNDMTIRYLPRDLAEEIRRRMPDADSDSVFTMLRLGGRIFAAGYDEGWDAGHAEGRDAAAREGKGRA